MFNKLIKIASFIILIAVAGYLITSDIAADFLSGNAEFLIEWSNSNVLLLLLITLVLMVVQNLFTIIPLILLITLDISIFGFWGGLVWSWLTSLLGASVSFYITRYWFQSLFRKYMNEHLRLQIEEKGPWFVFLGRIIPFMPTSIINIVSGMSTLTYRKFLLATTFGNFIYFFILSLITLGFINISLEYQIIVVLTVLTVFIYVKYKKNHHPREEHGSSRIIEPGDRD